MHLFFSKDEVFSNKAPECLVSIFNSDSCLKNITPSEVVTLFSDIAPEFGDGDMKYCFDHELSSVLIKLDGVEPDVFISDVSEGPGHFKLGHSNLISMKSILGVSAAEIFLNELNEKYSGIVFQEHLGHLLCEYHIEISNNSYINNKNSSVLDVMDNMVYFLSSIVEILA